MINDGTTTGQARIAQAVPVERLILRALIQGTPSTLAVLADAGAGLWPRVRARVQEHRCLPYLVWAMDHRAGTAPPEPALAGERRRWQMRALAIRGECLRLHRLLSDAGIAHLFLKGVPLAVGAYPEAWLRPLRDIDLLVAPEDLQKAQALLLDHGGPITRYAHKSGTPVDAGVKHLVPVWSPGRIIPVELHGHAADAGSGLGPEALARLDAALWQGAVALRMDDASLPVPGPEALFVHLVLHGIYDHELNNGPLFVTDLIHVLRRMPPDPAHVARLAADLGICRGLALALSLVPEETPVRAGLIAALRAAGYTADLPVLPEDSAAALLLQDSSARTELRLAADLAMAQPSSRVRLLAGKVFASRETMIDRWHMEGGDGPPPVSNLRFWLWFVRVRARRMLRRRAGMGAEAGGSGGPTGRDHLLRLRALRDGSRV